MKKIISVMLCVLIVFSSVSALGIGVSAADYDMYYQYDSGKKGYIVTGGYPSSGSSGKMIIPKTYKGKNVVGIDYNAFGCEGGIESIQLPSTMRYIAPGAFDGCAGLKSITVDDSNKYYTDSNGVLFNKKKTTLIAVPSSYPKTSYTVPSSVTDIAAYAFSSTTIEKIIISGKVTKIKEFTFYMSRAKSIVLPDTVTKIDDCAFHCSWGLTSIKLPTNLKTIGELAFYDSGIKSVKVPKSVTSIGAHAFGYRYCMEDPESFEKIPGFKIYGANGSKAQAYAKANSISFVKLSVPSKSKVKKVQNTSSGVKVSWDKVSGAEWYTVYVKTKNGSWKKLGTVQSTTYTHETAKSGTTYYYTVRALNAAGASVYDEKGVAIKYLAATKLSAPKSTKSGITLKWSKVAGASGYIVFRKTGSGDYVKLKIEKGISNLSYTDKSAKKGKKYTYVIKAYSGKTYSVNSNTKTITDKY